MSNDLVGQLFRGFAQRCKDCDDRVVTTEGIILRSVPSTTGASLYLAQICQVATGEPLFQRIVSNDQLCRWQFQFYENAAALEFADQRSEPVFLCKCSRNALSAEGMTEYLNIISNRRPPQAPRGGLVSV